MSKKQKCWSKSFGSYGSKVRLSEINPGSFLYLIWIDKHGKQQKSSLHHRDRKVGSKQALEIALSLATDRQNSVLGNITLQRLANLFIENGLHAQSEKYKSETAASLWRIVSFLGASRKPQSLGPSDITKYEVARRRGGLITADGKTLGRVGPTTVWHDVTALQTALNWATKEPDAYGKRLLAENPIREISVQKEANPKRPHAYAPRYQALRAVADQINHRLGLALDMAFATGHRINAILHLEWECVDFTRSDRFPHGSIRWKAEYDKMEHDHIVQMSSFTREVLLREHEIADHESGWLFPAIRHKGRPTQVRQMRRWLEKAELAAELEHVKGGGWHAFRRGWANVRKHYPIHDVAKAGGWKDHESLRKCYQEADDETVFRVIDEPMEAFQQKLIQKSIQHEIKSEVPDRLSDSRGIAYEIGTAGFEPAAP